MSGKGRAASGLPPLTTFLVGGAVRDALLDIPVQERDWVVLGATPQDMLARGFRPLDGEFPVFAHPVTGEEYALARRERKQGRGYKGFEVDAGPDVTLEEDLKRRDLTINAMARGEDRTLVDPFGGQEDLRLGWLRHVSPAFVEDPLRVLRVARFAARLARFGFRLTHPTHRLMREMAGSGELATLTRDRVSRETRRALDEDQPARYFEVLHRCGALAELLPELAAALGAPAAHGGDDAPPLPLRCLSEAVTATADTAVRLVALVQGLALASAPAAASATLERLGAASEEQELAAMAARYGDAPAANAASILETLEALDALRRGPRFERFLEAAAAVHRASRGGESAALSTLAAARAAAVRVDTRPLLAAGLRGPEIGKALRELRREAIRAAVGEAT